ncbi:hypothetical protein [Oceanobacter mangrovi]|uniref:hypothetical protein n=1 Tax=Oceanobacter mangrovi TaxID=2862510 RepID=UPI001C8E1372|nr:hypothetical protein [Oceanobacter mangrovi]
MSQDTWQAIAFLLAAFGVIVAPIILGFTLGKKVKKAAEEKFQPPDIMTGLYGKFLRSIFFALAVTVPIYNKNHPWVKDHYGNIDIKKCASIFDFILSYWMVIGFLYMIFGAIFIGGARHH